MPGNVTNGNATSSIQSIADEQESINPQQETFEEMEDRVRAEIIKELEVEQGKNKKL